MNTPVKSASIALLLIGAAAITSSAQTGDGFNLKHRSSFAVSAARNPFWPIGWTKGEGPAETQEAAPPISADKFDVTSISTGSMPLAVINGKTYGVGETITALSGDQKIKILVVTINDGQVVLQYLDKKYTIALKRPGLMHNPSSADDLLPKKNDNVLILR